MAEAVHLGAFIGIVRDRIAGRVDLRRDGSARVRYEPGPPERALLPRPWSSWCEFIAPPGRGD